MLVSHSGRKAYFSLSINDGHKAGRSFVAQSSSEKSSAVAASAMRDAFLACTNGSRRDLVNAATSTLVRDYYLVSKSKF